MLICNKLYKTFTRLQTDVYGLKRPKSFTDQLHYIIAMLAVKMTHYIWTECTFFHVNILNVAINVQRYRSFILSHLFGIRPLSRISLYSPILWYRGFYDAVYHMLLHTIFNLTTMVLLDPDIYRSHILVSI